MNKEIQSVLNGESEGCVVQGNCLDVMCEMPDGCVDLVLTDPPYGLFANVTRSGFMADRQDQEAVKWDTCLNTADMTFVLLRAIQWIVWGGNYYANILGACKAPLIWDKKTGENYFADCEIAWTSFASGTARILHHQWCGCFKDSERGIQLRPYRL